MISEKQLKILAFRFTDYDALICDGAIRSGKTTFMIISFIEWSMEQFNGKSFCICGKTVSSCCKNVIAPMLDIDYLTEKYKFDYKISTSTLTVSSKDGKIVNSYEIFGGKDESSYTLIQGRTFAGAFFDEVALQTKSFVEQATSRCSIEGSRFFFNCNPAGPDHWFYLKWIKEPKDNVLHLHFELDDNPSLSEKIKDRYKSMYSGVFYDRYILGQWVKAEGLVYNFDSSELKELNPSVGDYYLSIDYGTLNPFAALLIRFDGNKGYVIDEYYYNGREEKKQLTDNEYLQAIQQKFSNIPIRKVIVDPSAASFITLLKRSGFTVVKAKNDVLDGIRYTQRMISENKLLIDKKCKNVVREFGLYCWNEKASKDEVIKTNDHAMDALRYFCYTILRQKLR